MGGAEGAYSTAPPRRMHALRLVPFPLVLSRLMSGWRLAIHALISASTSRRSCCPGDVTFPAISIPVSHFLDREPSTKFCRGAGRRMWWTPLGWAHTQTCMDTQRRAGIQREFSPAGSSYALGNAASIWTVTTKWTNPTGWAGITAVLRSTIPQKQARTMS